LELQAMRTSGVTTRRDSHGAPTRIFIHTLALVARSNSIQRFAFLLLKENQWAS
jgi:hypothetical protein